MNRSPLLVVYLTVFIDLLGFGIILPALPFYAEHLGATGVWVGALLTGYSAAQFFGAPVLGRLSDRIGRRPVILASLAGSAVAMTITGLATTLPVLLLARIVAGLFGGSIATAQAYVADVTTAATRTRAMGLLGASIGMGFVFGPALGAALSPYGFGAAAFAAAGLAAANVLFGLFVLKESRPASERRPARGGLALGPLATALQQPHLGRVLLSTFCSTFAFVGMEATFALFGERRFNLTIANLGLIFTLVGIVMAIVQGGLIGRVTDRFGERAIAMTGASLLAVALGLLTVTPSLLAAIAVLVVLAAGQGLITPTLASLLSLESGADEQGSTLGLGQALAAAARAIGPLVAGWLFDLGPALPYIAGAGVMVLVVWLLRGLAAPRAASAVVQGSVK